MKRIKVLDNILAANDAWAEENRKFLVQQGITMLNIIGSPGSGKTALLERTADMLKSEVPMGVIEGDLETAKDARRIRRKGVAAVQINTGNACHLDAYAVHSALSHLCKGTKLKLIFVENIGNLVCPAEFDIGEAAKIAVLSTPEGDDKIEKYPLIFSRCAAMVISKSDLLSVTDFKVGRALKNYERINKQGAAFVLDSLSGRGAGKWIHFLKTLVRTD